MNIQDQIISTIWYTKRIINLTYLCHKIKKKIFICTNLFQVKFAYRTTFNNHNDHSLCVSLSSYINRKSSICDHLSPSTLIVFLLPRKKKLILSFFFFFIVIWVFACAPKRQLLPLVIKDETMYEYQWCSLTFFSRLYEKPSLRFDCCSESLSNNIDSMTMIKILNGLETTNILPI